MFHYSLLQALRDRERYGNLEERPEDLHEEPAERGFPDDRSQFALHMKRRRVGGVLKHMLADAGYGDLAKMVLINHRKEESQ